MKPDSQVITRRSVILLLGMLAGLAVVTARIGYIMLYPNTGTITAKALRKSDQGLDNPRGKIVDSNGTILATSIQRKSLYGNPHQIRNLNKVARKLSGVLDHPSSFFKKRLSKDRYFIWLERKLSPAKVDKIKKIDLSGIGFVPEYERAYPYGSLAGQVIGFVGIDNHGLEGIENQFDEVLSRPPSDRGLIQKTSTSNRDFSLKLTIDQTIQHIAEEELAKMAETENPKSALAVVMEPNTGKIRAMAQWPPFNPNKFWKYKKSNRKNKIITSVFEPGSTLKVMTIGAGLDKGSFRPQDEFHCKGYVYLRNAEHTLECYATHGTITVPEILIESCNVGAVKAANKIPPDAYYRYMRNFGFGNRTGIRLPGEASGDLPRPVKWSGLTQPTMAIGHGMSATALQMVTAFGAVVNDGQLMRPRIVASIRESDGSIKKTKPFPVRKVISRDIAENLQSYMRKVVTKGTGQKAQSDRYALGGKTGTAQKVKVKKGGYSEDKVMASFVGFGPVDDTQLVAGVFVDEPKKGYYGGEVAGPVFANIMERSLNYLEQEQSDLTVADSKPPLR